MTPSTGLENISLPEPCDLLILDFGRAAAADTNPVHEAVPAEGEWTEAPRCLQSRVDRTAVFARQPGPA